MSRTAASGSVHAFAVRLAVLAGVILVAVLVELRGFGPYSEVQIRAFYALGLIGFLLSLAYAASGISGRGGGFLHIAELLGDAALITALIYCSGGAGSLFGFLYILWIVHAARARGRSLVAAGVAIASYGGIALGTSWGVIPSFAGAPRAPADEAITSVGMHAAAFLSVTLLVRRLEREVEAGQHELIELGELHQRIVDGVSSGLLTVDEEGLISSFNREAERITGLGGDAVLGKPLGRLFPQLSLAARELENPPGPRGEIPFERGDGERLQLGFSRSLLRDARGQPDGAILIFQDLTQVRAMEERLRRSERLSAVGQLAAGLAHEVRNPLASLSGAIELLGADFPAEDASSRRLLRIVERETTRLNRLVVDFLAYAGGREPKRAPVLLCDLFGEIRDLLRSADSAQVELEVRIPPALSALGDPDQLRQVFWNLIRNAAEAEPVDRKIAVDAALEGADGRQRLRVEVRDRGCGIPAEQLERALEPFYTTKAKGTGLGLATVHRVVEAHGGELTIASEVGKGTMVSVVLDAADPDGAST